jgi:tetratricopeptide (TPR) repeat protein
MEINAMRKLSLMAALVIGLFGARTARADEAEDACLKGIFLVQDGEPRKALPHLDRAIQLNPKYAEAYAFRGRAWGDLRQLARGLADCNTAIRLDPQLARAYSHRGEIFRQAKQLKQALLDYNRAVQLDPKDAQIVNERGVTRFEMQDISGALRDYNQAIRVKPDLAEAYGNRGLAKLAIARLVEAFGKGAMRAFDSDPTTDRVARLDADAQADFEECYRLEPAYRPHIERQVAHVRRMVQMRQMFQKGIDSLVSGLAD